MSAWAFLLWVLAISIAVLILGAVWFIIEAARYALRQARGVEPEPEGWGEPFVSWGDDDD